MRIKSSYFIFYDNFLPSFNIFSTCSIKSFLSVNHNQVKQLPKIYYPPIISENVSKNKIFIFWHIHNSEPNVEASYTAEQKNQTI